MNLLPFVTDSQTWWSSFGAPLANHIWQSTLFAGAVGFVTLFLRNNHARTRHFLWLLASLKFLIPFSLLVAVGAHLGWSKAPASEQTDFVLLVQDFGRPFAAARQAPLTLHAANSLPALLTRSLPSLVFLVWFCGFAAVIFYWWTRSRRMTAAIRGARRENCGREFDLLRGLERAAGMAKPIDLMLSNSALEPGIFGIFRPVLLFPSGISDRLTDTQLLAVLAHELCHVRRGDNLTAALHMLVEAHFWFHPLVWWLGARLVDERERACDEEVLHLGSDPQAYAESILKICEFCLESPLLCSAGVTGSNLKKRIEAIMQNRVPVNLDFTRKLLLSCAGFLAVAAPLAFGLLHATPAHVQLQDMAVSSGAFESVYLQPNTTGDPMPPFIVHGRPMQAVSFHPDRFLATNFSLVDLIRLAYDVQALQIVGGPDWLASEKYDINAKLNRAEIEKLEKSGKEYSGPEHQRLVQELLADRFKLSVQRETRLAPVYALVVAQSGSKLHPAKPGDTYPDGMQCCGGRPAGVGYWIPKTGEMVAQGVSVGKLVKYLSDRKLGRPIVDKTGLSGNYDYTLEWTPDPSTSAANATLFTALEQQLGLKLEEQEGPVEVLVIENAEKPSASMSVHPAAS
jgi:bla regulator protein blaR1